jgi:hypothetical protein
VKYSTLVEIKKSLEDIFKELNKEDIKDNNLRHRYAEYLVASILAKSGYGVCLLNKRENGKADIDICVAGNKIRIEVKSGKYESDNWACASFGQGTQISKNKFDCCVFVTFDKDEEGKVNEFYVFTRDELKEVSRHRKGVARYEETNPCLLLRAPNFKEYSKYMRANKLKMFKIEEEFNRNPKKYKDAWNKIAKDITL